ncbi:MAG: hypothetical protein J6M31_04755 [Bacteroidales bacterium]|nr:hypothetical protein [Bacteroidales bacterium]
MKRLIISAFALLLGLTVLAQGTVTTRKYRYSDFTDKVTKVVLTGEDLLSGTLRQEVVNNWTVSAYEFCTLEDYERLKTQDRYYFLLLEKVRFKGEENPGIQFLSLVKGSPEAVEGLGETDEVIALPVASALGGNGRELVYLGALVRGIQAYTLAAMESEKNAYSKLEWFNDSYKKSGKMMQIYLAREDLAESVTPDLLERYLDSDMYVVESEEADKHYLEAPYNTLVSYVVAPVFPEKGSYCYKLLIEAESQELFYITRHKISAKKGVGFLPEDLKKLSARR